MSRPPHPSSSGASRPGGRALLALLAAAFVLAPAPEAAADDVCSSPSVGLVVCYGKNSIGTGTGFMVADRKHLVTNHHVVHTGARQDEPCERIEVKFGPEETIGARIKASRKALDLAVLELAESGPPPLTLYVGDPNAVKGKPVLVVGFPGIANEHFDPRQGADAAREGFVHWRDSSCTDGIVGKSGVDGDNRAIFESTADIRHGNSGGPLVDLCGNVIGIATYGRSLGDDSADYAVSARELVDKVLPDVGIRADTESDPCDPASLSLVLVLLLSLVGVGGLVTLVWAVRRPRPKPSGPKKTGGDADDGRDDDVVGPPSTVQHTLVGLEGPLRGESFPLDPGDFGLGREPAVCAVVLPPGTKGVSRHHATLRVRPDGGVLLQDNNSRAGTFVAGRRLAAAEWRPLTAGDVFALGDAGVRFELRDAARARPGA